MTLNPFKSRRTPAQTRFDRMAEMAGGAIRRSAFLSCSLAVLLCAGHAGDAWAQEREPAPVITRHKLMVDGKPLQYVAEVGRLPIRDAVTGKIHAYMFYTAYRVESKGKPRALTFSWGGGPGQTGMSADFLVGGPKRLTAGDGGRPVVIDNPATLLRDSDLVYIDQIGTGYSRPTDRSYAAEFNGTIGDTDAFAEFVRVWRIDHAAKNAPLFVGGASWGAPRAATVAYELLRQGIPVAGMYLISGETQITHPELPVTTMRALRVVGMSTVAFRWGKLKALGSDPATIHAEAEAWVTKVYAPALANPGGLTDRERDDIVAGLARFTGIKPQLIDRTSLEITPPEFRAKLLIDEGKTLNGFDTRVTAPPPSLPYDPVIAYLRDGLGYRTDLPFLDITLRDRAGFYPMRDVPQEPWDFATSSVTAQERAATPPPPFGGPPTIGKPLPATREAIERNPQLKVLVTISRYDGSSSCEANEALYAVLPANIRSAITLRCYDAGHAVRLDAPAAAQFARDFGDLVKAGSEASRSPG